MSIFVLVFVSSFLINFIVSHFNCYTVLTFKIFLFKMTIYNTLQEKNETLQRVVYVHELETVGVLIQ